MRPLWMLVGLIVAASACGTGSTANANGGGGAIQFTASGEVLALGGYAFPPATLDAPAFVDGWEVRFTKLLVTLDKITLSENPDFSPTDQSLTNKIVAQVDGPWAIDFHRGGPLAGKGGSDERAIAIARLEKQNRNGDKPFDETMRYAFGFDTVPASASAIRLNIDENDSEYAEMIANGYVVLYVGTATWKGTNCTSTNSNFDFTRLPMAVNFKLGFRSPTTYANCQNPDNDPAKALGSEEHARGIQIRANETTIAQVTFHTDHPFWESVTHDSPPHFDPLAALAKMALDGEYHVSIDDAVGINFAAFRFQTEKLPWRSCLSGYTPPNANAQMGFDSLSIPLNPMGDPNAYLRDYADYLAYNQSTQGHLNSDGLCYVNRHYPSPR
jgi:hypothetical protein